VARQELIPLAEPDRWAQALRGLRHGHAHTWGFCRSAQLTSGLLTYLYSYASGSDRVVCPIAERRFGGTVDAVSPYGFGGFCMDGACERFAADWTAFARSRGWVCGYLALNPLFCGPGRFPPAEAHVHNRLYVMDLSGSDQDLRARLSQNRRRQLRDWETVAGTLEHDREALARFLLDTYADFFARKGAGAATDFSAETVEAIARLDDVIVVGARDGGSIESVAVFGHTPHAADYLLNVSVPGGERHAVHLIWAGVERLRELGVATLNLGGGVREGDDLAEFKRRFGAAELPLVSLRQVYDRAVYEDLCRQAGVSADPSGWFPPYRAAAATRRAAP
jgi:hypothetical protein